MPEARSRLTIDMAPDLRRAIKVAAARADMSVSDFVITLITTGLRQNQRQEPPIVTQEAGARDQDHEDIWANYDPEKVRASLDALQGLFNGVNVDAYLEDIASAREQKTPGRRG